MLTVLIWNLQVDFFLLSYYHKMQPVSSYIKCKNKKPCKLKAVKMEMVGFEPTASCMPCKRSSQLSYTPGILGGITAARNTSATVLLCHIWFNYATGFFIFSHIFSPTLPYTAAPTCAKSLRQLWIVTPRLMCYNSVIMRKRMSLCGILWSQR